ncbi:LamG domain-containing protein [Haliangium sp.]|uniref:LamG domain-containing protein n=1 Tax=Haliangium sp. TaxID=2663208 RepID=UPI003D0C7A8C
MICSSACGEIVASGDVDAASDPVADAASDPGGGADAEPAPTADAAGDSADAGPDPTLIARYSLDAVDGQAFPDDSGNGHDAVCVGECPTIGGGVIGGAASFGLGPILQVEDSGDFVTPDGFTVSAWVRIRSLTAGAFSVVVSKPFGTGTANSWALMMESDGRPTFFSAVNEQDRDFLSGDEPLPLDQYVHLAISWNGAIKRLYVGGQLIGARADEILFTMDSVVIGADTDGGTINSRFDGFIDEVRIYGRTLDDTEIAALAATQP